MDCEAVDVGEKERGDEHAEEEYGNACVGLGGLSEVDMGDVGNRGGRPSRHMSQKGGGGEEEGVVGRT